MLPVSLMKWTEGPHYSEISMNYFKPESRKDRLVEPKNMNVEQQQDPFIDLYYGEVCRE